MRRIQSYTPVPQEMKT